MIKRYQISLRLKDMDIQDRAIKTSNKDSIALEFRDIIENDISYEEYKPLKTPELAALVKGKIQAVLDQFAD